MNPSSAFDSETLAELIARQTNLRGDAVALHWAGKSMTFRELDQRANRIAQALLRSGTTKRIAVLGRDTAESLAILFGAAKARLTVTFLNFRLTAAELGFILGDAEVSHLFVEGSAAGLARELEARGALEGVTCIGFGSLGSLSLTLNGWCGDRASSAPERGPSGDDTAVLLYTSGTTGQPKGVKLAHRAFLAIRRELERAGVDWWGFSADDVALHTLPLFHVGGLWWAMNLLAAGASLVVMPQFDPDMTLELIETHRISAACLVPAMLQLVLARQTVTRKNVRSLRLIAYGGAPIAESLLLATKRAFSCDLIQFYGLTETGNTAVCLRAADHVELGARIAAAGQPYPGVRLRCVRADGQDCAVRESGEIWICSPANMLGYWRRPEASAETLVDGWVRTGDAGYFDEDGYLYVCDRIKDMIISAGENIYPAEIERALAAHPQVREVAVIGVPDERWGEAVKAFVVVDGKLEARELLGFLRGAIAEFKFPRSIEFVASLPRTPSGKIKKHELRARYWEGRSRQVN